LDKSTPVQVKSGTKFKHISAGYNYNLAIDESGKLWGWGYNEMGQLGDGTAWHDFPIWINTGNSPTAKNRRNNK
jgi:alpha-tubulin suppressor-like RCC1 family protein